GGQLGAGDADLVAGAGFGGVGDHPGRVVGLVGVAVQGVESEVFAGVFEVVLLAPAGGHPVSDLRGGQVGAVGQDRGLVPAGTAPHDQPQPQRAGRLAAGLGAGGDGQVDEPFGELVGVGGAVGALVVHRGEGFAGGAGPGAFEVGQHVEPGGDDLGEDLWGVAAAVKEHRATAAGSDDRAQVR